MSEPKPMSLSAFVKLWQCEAEFEPEGEAGTWWFVWEPLDTTAGEDARPSIFGGHVCFYGRDGGKKLESYVPFHDLDDPFPNLLLLADGVWREVLSGRVVYRNGRWHMRWLTATNTRAARMMNAGFSEYRA